MIFLKNNYYLDLSIKKLKNLNINKVISYKVVKIYQKYLLKIFYVWDKWKVIIEILNRYWNENKGERVQDRRLSTVPNHTHMERRRDWWQRTRGVPTLREDPTEQTAHDLQTRAVRDRGALPLPQQHPVQRPAHRQVPHRQRDTERARREQRDQAKGAYHQERHLRDLIASADRDGRGRGQRHRYSSAATRSDPRATKVSVLTVLILTIKSDSNLVVLKTTIEWRWDG